MFDKKKFKVVLMLNDKSLKDIAEMLDISVTTLYRKMNGVSDFYRSEIQALCNELHISNPSEIFFADKVT